MRSAPWPWCGDAGGRPHRLEEDAESVPAGLGEHLGGLARQVEPAAGLAAAHERGDVDGAGGLALL